MTHKLQLNPHAKTFIHCLNANKKINNLFGIAWFITFEQNVPKVLSHYTDSLLLKKMAKRTSSFNIN